VVLGERWLLALLASQHSFAVPGWCQHVWLIALRKRSSAALLCAINGSLGRTPLFGLPYRPCSLGPATRIFCWLTPVVAVLHLHIRVFDSCAQALARSAAVCGERLV
jgi:hypothetical protein